jgi:putative methionine-R-sulfoxide reductase with GAF domain
MNEQERPSRARYNQVKSTLDLKWRRRAPQAERMMREVVDGLWDAFGEAPWTWCGFWLLQPDGKALQPGPARLEAAAAAVPATGELGLAASSGEPRRAGGVIFVPVLDKNGRVVSVFEVRSTVDFDDMDARWIERLLKAFQTIEKIDPYNP